MRKVLGTKQAAMVHGLPIPDPTAELHPYRGKGAYLGVPKGIRKHDWGQAVPVGVSSAPARAYASANPATRRPGHFPLLGKFANELRISRSSHRSVRRTR